MEETYISVIGTKLSLENNIKNLILSYRKKKFNDDKILVITLIFKFLDKGWSKRSSRRRYDSQLGHRHLIGQLSRTI